MGKVFDVIYIGGGRLYSYMGSSRFLKGALWAVGASAAIGALALPVSANAEETAAVTASSGLTVIPTEDVTSSYTGWASDKAGERYWYDYGVMARDKEAYDPESDAWYWFDSDGTMAHSKDAFIPVAGTNRQQGKWVRYDENGHMVKGEDYRYGGWYDFDKITGEMAKGMCWVSSNGGKWVYYDVINGQMAKGEAYLNYDAEHTGWYYFDDVTGAVSYGWKTLPSSGGKEVYYDTITGIMVKGYREIDGVGYTFDDITGAKLENNTSGSNASWSADTAYINKMIAKINQWGSNTDWAVVVDKASGNNVNDGRVAVFQRTNGSWKAVMTTSARTTGNTFTTSSRKITVSHRARWYWQDGYDINDWWVCYYPNWISDRQGHLVFNPDKGLYDEGQGFHYGYSSGGCVVMENKSDAEYIYRNVTDGSTVLLYDNL